MWIIGAAALLATASPAAGPTPIPPPPFLPAEIVIASEGARPPFNQLDAKGALAGFEVDLAREICRRIAVRCRFTPQDWDGLIEGLNRRQYDVVMAALEMTPERRGEADFSRAYVRPTAAFVVRADSPLKSAAAQTLAGKTIGVADNSTAQTYVETRLPQSEAKVYGGLVEAMLDLAENKVDAVLADEGQARDFLKTRKEAACCRLLGAAPRDAAVFGEGFGAAFRKGDPLRGAFDAALTRMFDDGAFQAIARRYFSYPVR